MGLSILKGIYDKFALIMYFRNWQELKIQSNVLLFIVFWINHWSIVTLIEQRQMKKSLEPVGLEP